MQSIWSRGRRYLLALALIAAAIALRAALDSQMGTPSVAIYLAAIVIGAWLGGFGPGVLCVVSLHLVHSYFYRDPPGLTEPNLGGVVSTVGYYVVGLSIGALSQLRSAAQLRARDEHEAAVAQREQLRSTLTCIADGVLVTDAGGRVTLINPAAEAMTGWKSAEARGQPWHAVVAVRQAGDPQAADRPIERVLSDRGIVQGSALLTTRTGQTLPIAYSAAPVQETARQTAGAVLCFRDESERQRTELALRNADRRKDEFLATLAHELRNPLAPIATGLELLKLSTADPAGVEEVRAMMERQTKHMVRLIDDLMDVSRITRGKLELRQDCVEVAAVVRSAVEAARPVIEQAQHQLEVRLPPEPLPLYADANRLTQVLVNLLNNSAKYTPSAGRIELTAERVGGEVVMTVSDTGIGIPADKLDRVFEMFAQIHQTNESGHTGMGIGLTLVKRLVELHGGSVEVHSRGRNLGATFRLRLPLLPPSPAQLNGSDHGTTSPPLATKPRVLVVDDNLDALETMSRLVSLMGGEVRRAHDGLEAIEVAQAFQPEVVLMDLGMPRLNGYDAARRMRQEPWGQRLTLVATSGWGQEGDRQRTAEAGFDRHLVKPIETAALREVLEGCAAL